MIIKMHNSSPLKIL